MTGLMSTKDLMKRVPRFEPGGPVDKGKNIKVPEPKPILQREEKVKVNWKSVGKWLMDFHNQKHPFQKGTGKIHQPTKLDKTVMTIVGGGKFKIAKNMLVAAAQRIAPDLIDKVQNYFSSPDTMQSYLASQVIDEAKIISNLPSGKLGIVDRIGEERYNEYLRNFTEIYKNKEISSSIRNEVGQSRWSKSVQDAKNAGYLTQADVDKYGVSGAAEKGWITRRGETGLTIKEQKWEALQETLNELAANAPTKTENNVTKPLLPHLWDGAENVIPILKEKYPDLFYDWDALKKTDWKKYRQLKSGDNMPSRNSINVPDFFKDFSEKGSSLMSSMLKNFTKPLPMEDTQYFMDMFRSRPDDLRTGNVKNDTVKFLDFYKQQGVFNPNSEVYYKNDPEYLNYVKKRQEQPKGTHLSHMTPTLNPAKSQTVPFSGAEVEGTQFLPKEVNTELQPQLETELKKLLKEERTPENIKNIQQVEETMIDNNIITQMTDPQTGEVRYYGGTKDLKMNKGGMIQRFDNGGEAETISIPEASGISSEPLSEEQDTSGVAGLMEEDINQFIPPNLRFAKNLTGNMVLDFGSMMARYMTPGLGEYLSHEDYKLYSSELAQAVQNKEFLAAAGLTIPTALAMAGTIPNYTLVGIPISMAEAAVKKIVKPKIKKLEKPKDIRFKIRDKDGKTVYQTKNKQEAEDKAQKLSSETGEDYIVDEIEFMPKEKVEVIESKPYDIVNDAGQVVATKRNKNQAEKYLRRHPNENLKMVERNVPDVQRLDTTRLIDVGDNRQFYSKSQQAFDNGFDLSTGDAALTAKEWHNFFRQNGVREQELVDSYIRTLLDRKGGFNKETQTFTSNTKIKASEIKDLIDNAPAMKVQSVQFSDASGNLKYGDTGRLSGAEAGSKRENIIWIDSADIRGDPGQLSSVAQREGTQHKNFYDVQSDTVKFDAGKAKLEGEPYVIGWSLVDTRKGKDAFGKPITVDLASEIQSDLLQKAATKKAQLKQKISQLGTANPAKKARLLQEIEYIFRPMGKTATEIQELIERLTLNQQKFTSASKLELDDVNSALLKELDQAKIDRDLILNDMFNIVDNISINDLYPNIPLKNSKDWVDSIVKNDVYLAAKNRFTILEDGTIKINENAPSHYATNSAEVVKRHWGSTGDEAGQMYDIIYNNAADSLKRISKTTGADVQLGKVKQGGNFVEVPMIELVPEMLYSQVQYFKDGGLVQKQYSPLVPLFKPLGVSHGY